MNHATDKQPAPIRKSKMNIRQKETIHGLLFISPWVIGFLIFTLYPICSSLYYSLCEYQVIKDPVFIGFDNYKTLFHDKTFLKAMSNTFYMVILGVPITTFIAVTVSIMLNNKKLHYTGPFRIVFFIPTLVPTVVACLLWIWVMQPETGIVNKLLGYIGIKGPGWLSSMFWSKPALILMMIWTCGNAIIIYLAGLQDIPSVYYEALEIDGGNAWHKFWNVTLPMISSTLFFNLVMGIINALQVFGQAYIITEGGPNNASLFYVYNLWRQAFKYMDMGMASAMAWVLFLVVLVLTAFVFKTSNKWVYYEGGEE